MGEIQNVAIIGAGTMGHSLAQVFAQGGCNVWLNDVKDEILARAKKLIASNLSTLSELGIVEKGQREPILARIHTTPRLEEAGKSADFVIESIIEDQAAKKEMFSR
ncbi:MAG TPA: 3-hydroxyacyl-CoA dehydrogenase NAD-binding domain-containing protein, partial [Thermodesulfobacteriota bacterium]